MFDFKVDEPTLIDSVPVMNGHVVQSVPLGCEVMVYPGKRYIASLRMEEAGKGAKYVLYRLTLEECLVDSDNFEEYMRGEKKVIATRLM